MFTPTNKPAKSGRVHFNQITAKSLLGVLRPSVRSWLAGFGSMPQITGKTETVLADTERAVEIEGKTDLTKAYHALRSAHSVRGDREAMLKHLKEAVEELERADKGVDEEAEDEKAVIIQRRKSIQTFIGSTPIYRS